VGRQKNAADQEIDQAAKQQEALETRARATWRRRVRSSRIFMSTIVAAGAEKRQGKQW
jgi:hypothetical protein